MTLKFYCDRCGKEVRNYSCIDNPLKKERSFKDLCKPCFKIYLNLFKKFIKGG